MPTIFDNPVCKVKTKQKYKKLDLEWYTSPVNIREEGQRLQLHSLHDVQAETTTWTVHLIPK
jgi:hypothetical protein